MYVTPLRRFEVLTLISARNALQRREAVPDVLI
jgi:hypothetical protein